MLSTVKAISFFIKCSGYMLCSMLCLSNLAQAEEGAQEGKELYHEVAVNQTINGVVYTDANCETCHSTAVYTRTNRRVSSFAQLETFVERCNTNLDVGWFPEEVSAVAIYLNQEYYQLDK